MTLIITIKVIPSSKKLGFIKDNNGTIKCFLKSSPEHGLVNKELIKILSKALFLAKNQIEIISGFITRLKRVTFHTHITEKAFCETIIIAS